MDSPESRRSTGGCLSGLDELTNVDGLSQLVSVEGRLWIFSNPALASISGLSGVTSVGEDVKIYENETLCQSAVDDQIASWTIGGETETYGNDDGC